MNQLADMVALRNTYFVMRHGQSKANERGIIVSHPENGLRDEFGLTSAGEEQVHQSAASSTFSGDVIIYSSDFSRARQTANAVCQLAGAADAVVSESLRERNFGDWELTSSNHYALVWGCDESASGQTMHGVESVDDVLARATKLIIDLEQLYEGREILLVSHGDTLQILQTGFAKINPALHRSLRHLETAEIRQMSLAASSAP